MDDKDNKKNISLVAFITLLYVSVYISVFPSDLEILKCKS